MGRLLPLCAAAAVLAVLCLLAYTPSFGVPLFADSYIQIQLGRDFGPAQKWSELFYDPLARCRFTSIVVTHWTEQWFSLDPRALRLTSLTLHWGNCLLLFALGAWPRLGYKTAFASACFFAVYQRPQEAVAWYAALPDLLVFFFFFLALWCWLRFLAAPRAALAWYAATLAAFVLALLSKESAVVFPLAAAALAGGHTPRRRQHLEAVIPFAVLSAVYFLAAWFAREGVLSVLARTAMRLFWIWGLLAAGALLWWRRGTALPLLGVSLAWIALASLPFAFLAGQRELASHQMYLAAPAIAVVVGRSAIELWRRRAGHTAECALVFALCVVYQVGTQWAYRHPEILARSRSTTALLQAVDGYTGPVAVECFPEGPVVAEHILAIATQGHAWPSHKTPQHPARRFDGCDRKPAAQAGGSGT
jgi:hypothetical protein